MKTDQLPRITPSNEVFYREVLEGLDRPPRQLPSKYFYDATGDRLFQQIMDCPEYYLTRCEMEIMTRQTDALVQVITKGTEPFQLIELGAGDGQKTIHLLKALVNSGARFTYRPIDISANTIDHLNSTLPSQVPGLELAGLNGEYLPMLELAASQSVHRKILLFLGANIGNLTITAARDFCIQLRKLLLPGDKIIIGFDLKKAPWVIRSAYDDAAGFTRKFNLNLLTRINRELGADFDTQAFRHYCSYDPQSGACKSYLVTLKEMTVHFPDRNIYFEKDEFIWTEISLKYSLAQIDELAETTGFQITDSFFDSHRYFTDSVWTAV